MCLCGKSETSVLNSAPSAIRKYFPLNKDCRVWPLSVCNSNLSVSNTGLYLFFTELEQEIKKKKTTFHSSRKAQKLDKNNNSHRTSRVQVLFELKFCDISNASKILCLLLFGSRNLETVTVYLFFYGCWTSTKRYYSCCLIFLPLHPHIPMVTVWLNFDQRKDKLCC